jgi:hypothetical protein
MDDPLLSARPARAWSPGRKGSDYAPGWRHQRGPCHCAVGRSRWKAPTHAVGRPADSPIRFATSFVALGTPGPLTLVVDRYFAETEDQLRQLAKEGLLAEDHYIDLKRELPSGRRANKETARDLASFSIDGGALYIGVAEAEPGSPPHLHAVPLEGLPERIDQVARSVVSPPLAVHPHVIPSTATPTMGYVLVRVPPSPDAPHMVDGRYWGRGAVTKEALADARVREVFQQRRAAREDAARLLAAVVKRDPTPPHLRDQAHLFILAHPVLGPSDLLLRAFGDASGQQWLGDNILRGPPAQAPSLWAPDLHPDASNVSRRAGGWALHSYEIGADRALRSVREDRPLRESSLLDIELDEDGTLRLFCGRATENQPSGRVVFEVLIAGLTRRVLVAAAVVAKQGGYLGPWVVGLAVTNLRGAVSYYATQNIVGQAFPYSEDGYRATTEVSFDALQGDPDRVVDQLFGRLNRALTAGRFNPAQT